MLNQEQFDLLTYLAYRDTAAERQISMSRQMSPETVNRLMKEFSETGYVFDGAITDKGIDALEPYRVKRAVFIAAGFGSRLVPITLNTPKPLVRVNGKRIIDTLLDAVVAAGIKEIYIIRGYLAEQFDTLLYKYPMIKFIENPAYNEANNILSVACAGALIKNAYVFESDLVLSNPALITKYQYSSNYLAIPVDKTEDWCFYSENGIIKKMTVGGAECHQMVGISYWTDYDGARLTEHIKEVYHEPYGKKLFWDQVPLEYRINDYTVAVRECRKDDVVEIDSFKELKAIDRTYDV